MIELRRKQAAMFGLDARIALAIFGALSVISGAALYSAIESANAEKYRQMLLEINKASDAYYLSIGSPLSIYAASVLNTSLLLDNLNSTPTWNGPYLTGYSKYDDSSFTNSELGGRIYIYMALFEKDTWSTENFHKCSAGDSNCSEWVVIRSDSNAPTVADDVKKLQNIFSMLDNLVDNGDGSVSGNVRYIPLDAVRHYILFKGRLRKI